MQRGVIVVQGVRTDGTLGDIDVLDLDDESFRCYVLDRLAKAALLDGRICDLSVAKRTNYKQRMPIGHPRVRQAQRDQGT